MSQLNFIVLSGWAQPAQALEPLRQVLELQGTVTIIELNAEEAELAKALNRSLDCSKAVGRSTVIVGWSLGGQVAIRQLYRALGDVQGLVLIGCNPMFIGDEAWPGVTADIFVEFNQQLNAAPGRLLQHFNRLQMLGARKARELVRESAGWQQISLTWGKAWLQESLQWLEVWDVRPQLAKLDIPVLHLLGGRDSLVPTELLAQSLAQFVPQQRVKVIESLAHYPDPESCVLISDAILEFLPNG